MALFTPQYNLYKVIGKIKVWTDFIFWLIFFLSIIPAGLKLLNLSWPVDDLINVINIAAILIFFILDIIVDYIFIPQAEQKRRDDFIDNSFNSKFAVNNSIQYFDNDEINYGLYKAAVNLFQNCFFTYSLIKLATPKKVIVPTVILLIIWVSAYFGFKEVPFFLSLLQLLFSANILGNLIRHLIMQNRLSVIYDGWVVLFQYPDFDNMSVKYNNDIVRNWLRYETLLTKIPANISDKFFNKHNPRLTQDWMTLKTNYNIR
jgi:hypothetical protein